MPFVIISIYIANCWNYYSQLAFKYWSLNNKKKNNKACEKSALYNSKQTYP